jgi:hypothetical protein
MRRIAVGKDAYISLFSSLTFIYLLYYLLLKDEFLVSLAKLGTFCGYCFIHVVLFPVPTFSFRAFG